MSRLRRVDCAGPGITRRRRGRGFVYEDAAGTPVRDPAVLQRIADLAIPPAWTDVWICPVPSGHIQAVGTDAAGRRQYRYHDDWRRRRDREKHERMVEFAQSLPAARRRVAAGLERSGFDRERVLATAFRLLDLGFFRVGSEQYVEDNGTFGLATIEKRHVRVGVDGTITFDYPAKSGKRRIQAIADPLVCEMVTALKLRRGGGRDLLAYVDDAGRWVDVRSDDINAYVRAVTGGEHSAKDFRTWHATVLCAVALAVSTEAPASPTARKRAVARAVSEVAHYLGNTPAVCRASYIDPRVMDRYNDGVTVARELSRLGSGAGLGDLATQGAVEAAVLRLLRDAEDVGQVRAAG